MEKRILRNDIFCYVIRGEGNEYMLPVPLNGIGSWVPSMLQLQNFFSLNGVENPKHVLNSDGK